MEQWTIYWNDWLVRRFMRGSGSKREYSYHRKRVPKDCPLTRDEVRVYVEKGSIQAVKLIMKRGLGLRDAKDLLDQVRGENTIWKPHEVRR